MRPHVIVYSSYNDLHFLEWKNNRLAEIKVLKLTHSSHITSISVLENNKIICSQLDRENKSVLTMIDTLNYQIIKSQEVNFPIRNIKMLADNKTLVAIENNINSLREANQFLFINLLTFSIQKVDLPKKIKDFGVLSNDQIIVAYEYKQSRSQDSTLAVLDVNALRRNALPINSKGSSFFSNEPATGLTKNSDTRQGQGPAVPQKF